MNTVASYSGHEVIKAVQNRLEEERGEEVSFEEAEEATGQLDYEHLYEAFMSRLKREMKALTDDRFKHEELYHVSGTGIGWRNRSGERIFKLSGPSMARDLVQKLTPDRDFSLELLTHGDDRRRCFTIRVSHHDSPQGESYRVTPVRAARGDIYKTHGEKQALEYSDPDQ